MTTMDGEHRTDDRESLILPARPEAQSNGKARKDRPAILVVDDDTDARELLAALMELACDAQVLTAADNASALDHLRQSHVDLIIQDLMRPGGTGIELLQALKGDPRYHSVRVIVVSGHAERQPAAGQEALREGADAVFQKPFENTSLCEAVHRILGVSKRGGHG